MSCIPNVASVSEISELFILDSPMPLRVSLAFIFDSISSYRGRQLVEETTVFGEKSRELTIIEDMLRCHTHWQTLIQLLFGRRHDEPQESCFNNQNLRAFVLINELLIPVGQAYHNIKKLKSRFSVAIIKFTNRYLSYICCPSLCPIDTSRLHKERLPNLPHVSLSPY